MKYSLLISFAMLPLAVLTALSLWEATGAEAPADDSPDTTSINEEELGTVVRTVQDRAASELLVVQPLLIAMEEPFADSEPLIDAKNSELKPAVENWVKFRSARQVAVNVAQSERELPILDVERDEDKLRSGTTVLEHLRRQLTESPAKELRDVDDVRRAVDDRIVQFNAAIRTQAAANAYAQAITDAKSAYRDGDYARCRTLLENYREQLSTDLTSLSSSAEFRQRGVLLGNEIRMALASKPSVQTWPVLIATTERFITGDFASPPLESDKSLHDALSEGMRQLRMYLAIDDFARNAPNTPAEWSAAASSVIALHPREECRVAIRARTRAWVLSRLPEKDAPTPSYQYVMMKDTGRVIEGYFESAANGTYYKYFKDADAKLNNVYGPILPDKLAPPAASPQSPRPKQCALQYAKERAELIDRLDSLGAWETFHKALLKQKADLKDYGDRGGRLIINGVEVVFDLEIEFAAAIVQDWKDIETLLAR